MLTNSPIMAARRSRRTALTKATGRRCTPSTRPFRNTSAVPLHIEMYKAALPYLWISIPDGKGQEPQEKGRESQRGCLWQSGSTVQAVEIDYKSRLTSQNL